MTSPPVAALYWRCAASNADGQQFPPAASHACIQLRVRAFRHLDGTLGAGLMNVLAKLPHHPSIWDWSWPRCLVYRVSNSRLLSPCIDQLVEWLPWQPPFVVIPAPRTAMHLTSLTQLKKYHFLLSQTSLSMSLQRPK